MEFNSQICTTKEQSERLLALELRRETADMCMDTIMGYIYTQPCKYIETAHPNWHLTPLWSLHRLIEMIPKEIFHESKQWHLFLSLCYENAISYEECDSSEPCYLHFCSSDNIYDNIIESIEWLIKGCHFNKEYLN